jgi:glycosyltransferase involved in cell wall biosynthesis
MKEITSILPISAIIITYNEEDNIHRTLSALGRLAEVIVVDSNSTDQTQSIVQEFSNTKLHIRPFDNMMNQWNFGHTLAKYDWILSLDADYLVTDELLDELVGIDLNKAGYQASFRYCIYGHPLRSAVLPPRVIYYNRQYCTYFQDGHTQRLSVNGKTGKFRNPIFHDDRKPLNRWLWSQQNYSAQESKKLMESEIQLSPLDRLRKNTILSPFIIFLYCLFWKGGIFEGRKGLFYAIQRLFAETILVIRIIDRKISQEENKRRQ